MTNREEILERMKSYFLKGMKKALYDVMDEVTVREQEFEKDLEAAAFFSLRLSTMAGRIALEAVADELSKLKAEENA